MDVTYLIGNGFDLGIGLKTRFEDFLKYYLKVESKDEDIIDFKETIKRETIDLWADFEVRFGKYSIHFNKDNFSQFIKIYEDVLKEMNMYLKNEVKKIPLTIQNYYINKFKEWILLNNLISMGFRPAISHAFEIDTNYYKTDIINHNFLIYNYTKTFDDFLNFITEKDGETLALSQYIKYGKPQDRIQKIGEVIHIHGELDKYMILGVNDEKQFWFPDDLPDEITKRMIKPVKNVRIGSMVEENGTNIINGSSVIFIYGMSMGETDTIWWERIGKWLESDIAKRIILFVYNPSIDTQSVTAIDYLLEIEEQYRNDLLKTLKIPTNKFDLLKEKVIIVINSDFMQMKLVKEDKKDEVTV